MNGINVNDIEKLNWLKQLLSGVGNVDTRQITLKEFVDEYLEYTRHNLSFKSLIGIESLCRKLFAYYSPVRPLDSIKRLDAEKLLRTMSGTAPKGYRVYFRTLRAMFSKAKEWNYIRENPFASIKLPKSQRLKPQYLNMIEFGKVHSKIEMQIVKDVSDLCFNTGLRLSEASNLKWRNVDLQKKLLTIGDEQFKTKTRNQRVVPMNNPVYELFLKLRSTRGTAIENEIKDKYVFAKKNGKILTADYISKQFKKACREAGVDEGIHFHSLRHSAASNMVDKGVPIYSVQRILGHSSITTTQIYAHLEMDALREAVEKLQV